MDRFNRDYSPDNEPLWRTIYLVLFSVQYILIVVVFFAIAQWAQVPISTLWYGYFMLTAFPLAERFSDFVVLLASPKPCIPPRQEQLSLYPYVPNVAILYCTRDDAVPECIVQIQNQTYPGWNAFILDDSEQIENQHSLNELVSKLELQYKFKIIRRTLKTGYKAGNINNWLRSFENNQYDYFVVLDADSILPQDFVKQMLLYAEHPANQRIACFESQIEEWCPHNGLQRTSSVHLRIAGTNALHINNRLGTMLSNGHNNLCRTAYFRPDPSGDQSPFGFDERFIAEDHATTLNLFRRGLRTYSVDVTSSELSPASLYVLKRRTYRWVRNDLQLLTHTWEGIPFILQIKIITRAITHILWLPTAFCILVMTWAQSSSFGDLREWLISTANTSGGIHPQTLFLVLIYGLYLLQLSIGFAGVLLKTHLKRSEVLYAMLITFAQGFGTMFAIIHATIATLARKPFAFQVTPKTEPILSLHAFVNHNWLYFVFVAFAIIGTLRNPLILRVNFIWFAILVASPLVLYFAQCWRQTRFGCRCQHPVGRNTI